jgi:TonB-dependent SusC/RagA subfamily outer membrane receptor
LRRGNCIPIVKVLVEGREASSLYIRWLMPYLRYSARLRFPRTAHLLAVVAVAGCQTHQPSSAVSQPHPVDSVAVGYGSQARRDVTGAVASLDGDVARRNSPVSMADMLEGRFAGVEVRRVSAGGISVRIRGQRTFKGDAEPLFVIDGVPQRAGAGGTLSDIDPRDVQSIEVLKDAGATAIYGSRGANGVILITTRRPE